MNISILGAGILTMGTGSGAGKSALSLTSKRLLMTGLYTHQLRRSGAHHSDHVEPPGDDENPIRFKFTDNKGNNEVIVKAREGESLLEVAHNNGVELEGACE